MTTSFYAELLPNIRSISVSIAPPTPSNVSTRAIVTAGSSSILLQHDGICTSLVLPAKANPGPQEIVISPKPGEDNFSCRLPVIDSAVSSETENFTPWSAFTLSSSSSGSIHCGTCDSSLLDAGTITTWKDLPSANWAEMMDFWHCHKPDEKQRKSSPRTSGKYSSFGQELVVDSGTGLVEKGYFLFAKKDCENAVKITTTANNASLKLSCKSCGTLLGVPEMKYIVGKEDTSNIWRLNKWNLCFHNAGVVTTHELECFLASQFLSYAEDEGARRLLIKNNEDASINQLKLWIFNTDIRYTHTLTPQPVRGIKVYWHLLEAGEEPPRTDRVTSTGFEGVELDDSVFSALMNCLTTSSQAMPEDLRTIGEWNAGALKRFEKTP
ncbi:ubiquitin-conjugating enzyme E2-binding protein [Geopyxis carbonaria]|nr:ubiquitin-conjugating enzyme E2-binding protein [Geopyxis carbonaria]